MKLNTFSAHLDKIVEHATAIEATYHCSSYTRDQDDQRRIKFQAELAEEFVLLEDEIQRLLEIKKEAKELRKQLAAAQKQLQQLDEEKTARQGARWGY